MGALEFRLLGPLEVRDGDRSLPLGGRKQRTVLAILLLHANEVVSSDTLIDGLWGEHAPKTAGTALQVYVSNLRKLLAPERLETRTPGYLLHVETDELDLARFERLCRNAHGLKPEAAATALDEALLLWHGQPLAEFAFDPFAQVDIARLEELRLEALEQRLEAELQLGRHETVVGELQALVAEHPFRERPRRQLMLALYRSGRQTEALEAYQDARRTLVAELGIEPSAQLRQLEQAVLRQDDSLRPPSEEPPKAGQEISAAEARSRPAVPAVRKTVTTLFCNLVESTQLSERLDAEAVRTVMGRCNKAVQTTLERHGGTVEKLVGDVVMAVFGVPLTHEDDALRAVRSAAETRLALGTLNAEFGRDYAIEITTRIGINTGEAIAAGGEQIVVGAAVNLAARLQQVAQPGEILLGEDTQRLVREVALVERAEKLTLKGKGPRSVWRLLAVLPDALPFTRPLDTPFVGREDDLTTLRKTFERAVAGRRCELMTVLGPPGIGKSRLIREFAATVRDHARVLVGRCLPYGDGITYWPLVEVTKGIALEEPRAVIRGLIGDEESAERVSELVAAAVGASDRDGSTEETHWAVRKLFEALAEERPLVVVFEDLHWAEPTFLDLIEHIAGFSADAPIILLGSARPELLEIRSGWATPGPSQLLLVEPLSELDVDKLVDALLDTRALAERLRAPTIEAAEGNPLFIEQLLAVDAEEESGSIAGAPTLHALLASRVDSLEPGDRAVIERASIEGRNFHRGAVASMLPASDRNNLGARLLNLVRKDLIRPDRSQFEGDDGFRFVHVLLRDAAYESMSKELRAELHAQHADWLERRAGKRAAEYEEILGYHLEQAYWFRRELWPADERTRALGFRGSELLGAAGARALGRDDVGASLKLLSRALALQPDDESAVGLRLDLSQALFFSGEFSEAAELASDAAKRAADCGDQVGELRARLAAARIAAEMPREPGRELPSAELLALAEQARRVFARAGDDVALTEAWLVTAWAQVIRSQWVAMLEAVDHASVHARRARNVRWERELPAWRGTALVFGPTPVDDALYWYEAEQPKHSMALNERAILEAMRGRFTEARALIAAADARANEREETIWRAGGWMATWEVETLAGNEPAGESAARRTCEFLERLGDTAFRSLATGQLASSLYGLGRRDEAERWTRVAEELSSSDDVTSNMMWRQVRAKLLARSGQYEDAERLAREAVDLGQRTDMLNWHARALADLAQVFVLRGRTDDAVPMLEQALALYERKGNTVMAADTRSELAQLKQAPGLVTERTI